MFFEISALIDFVIFFVYFFYFKFAFFLNYARFITKDIFLY